MVWSWCKNDATAIVAAIINCYADMMMMMMVNTNRHTNRQTESF